MTVYAIIQGTSVINIIDYENEPSNPPPAFPEGTIAVIANGASVGWTYQNYIFTAPRPNDIHGNPCNSWTLINNVWTPPTPQSSGTYGWDESKQSWI